MQTRRSATTRRSINGAVIPARSENDTGNNPHNPLYGIQRAGADGSILTLIGSQNSDSGGNSMAPLMMIDPEFRPTKVDRPSDVTGLVDTGDSAGLLSHQDAIAVMEAIYRISERDGQRRRRTELAGHVTRDQVIEDLVRCGYLEGR